MTSNQVAYRVFVIGLYEKFFEECCCSGSIFLPSKQLLARMRYRPWNGVFLSPDYLESVEDAERITMDILKIYHDWKVVPLIESRVTNVRDLAKVRNMLQVASSLPEGSLDA
jgi:hypothetical protein